MQTVRFPNHGVMEIRFSIKIKVDGKSTLYVAKGDERRKYTANVEKHDDGWAAFETSDTGSGAIIVDGCASKYEAVRFALLFISCAGGKAIIPF